MIIEKSYDEPFFWMIEPRMGCGCIDIRVASLSLFLALALERLVIDINIIITNEKDKVY